MAFDSRGKRNVYVCETCNRSVTTIDVDSGVTPFLIACQRVGGPCETRGSSRLRTKGMMQSSFYRVGRDAPEPTFEWYRPTPAELAALASDWERDHVDKGGLLLRPITDAGLELYRALPPIEAHVGPMSPSVTIILDGDGCWPDLEMRPHAHVRTGWSVAALDSGMESGLPSVAIRVDLEDGSSVVAETSLRVFLTIADAFRAKFADVLALSKTPSGPRHG